MRKSGRMEEHVTGWSYEFMKRTTRKRQENKKYEDRKQNSASGWILYAGGIWTAGWCDLNLAETSGFLAIWAKEAGKVFAEIANKLAETEKVYMLTEPETEAAARELLCENVEILTIPTDDAWARDVGPTFVTDGKEVRGGQLEF